MKQRIPLIYWSAMVAVVVFSNGLFASAAAIVLAEAQSWPSVACTPGELERLRAAYRGQGEARAVAAQPVRVADEALRRSIEFPPEGGQHNQWYQCDKCQIALQTVDETHHRCRKCETVYSGYPYDNVIFSRRHSGLTQDMNACAWAYALTGNEKYARHAREILTGYAERYTRYPYHSASMGRKSDKPSRSGGHVFEQTLNEASWMEAVCEAYDLIRPSRVLSADDHRAVREGLLMPVYRNIDKHRAGKSNWQTYHNSALMLIGGVLHDVNLVRQAIEDPNNGFYYQMKTSVLPEGMWYENSWSYHFYTLGAVQRIVETARRLGIDLYRTPEVKKMYLVALDYRMIDGTLPRFGDAVTTRIPGPRYEAAWHAWKEPAFLEVLPEGPTWDSVLYGRVAHPGQRNEHFTSALKEGAGHAILRTQHDEGAASAVLTFGPFGGFHGHFDKLSFVYFALGKELGYDSGRARSQAYRLPVHKDWYRATTGHNTVLVDRISQEGVEGRLELFVAEAAVSAVAASVDKAYRGILHHRLLVMRPGFLVLADLLDAADGRSHTFDWMYHNRGRNVSSTQAQATGGKPRGQGFEYIEDVRQGATDDTVRAAVASDRDTIHVLVNGQAESQVLIGTGVGDSVLDRVPLVFVTRQGRSARFAAVIDPTPASGSAQVKDVALVEHGGDGYTVNVTLADGNVEAYAYRPRGGEHEVFGRLTTAKFFGVSQTPDGKSTVLIKVE